MHRNQLAHEQEIRLRKLRPEKDRFYSEDPALRAAGYPEVIAAASILVRLRSDQPDFAPIRYGGTDARWKTQCI